MRSPTLFDPLDRYEALRQRLLDGGADDLPSCDSCGDVAECEDAAGTWCWDCAKERETER